MSQAKPTRRQFAKRAALVAAAPLAAAVPTVANAAPQDLPAAAESIDAQAAALTGIIRGRYGKHLTDEQLKRVQQRVAFGLRMSQGLRQFPLTNHDEPAFVFQADVP